MKRYFQRARKSKALRNASLSYFSFFSNAAWNFISIPLAIHYLDRNEIGLWTIVQSFVSYLKWMDMGLGSTTGRLMADSVVAEDQLETNRWWSLTRVVLLIQATLIAVIGCLATPFLFDLLNLDSEIRDKGVILLSGAVLITAMALPMRGATALLTVQGRFHWVPLGQGFIPWVNLLIFYYALKMGYGINAYLISMLTGNLVSISFYHILLKVGPNPPKWDSSGIQYSRFKRLFKFSSIVSFVGIIDALVNSIPTMLLARFGGISLVPTYNFTSKGPKLTSGLVSRTYQAFYPDLLRTYVAGDKELFAKKHERAGQLTLGIAILVASLVLIGNQSLVQLLAGSDYYAHSTANIFFAVAVITVPLAGVFRILLPISGSMAKSGFISILQLITGSIGGFLGWKYAGLAGVAAVFSFLPLLLGLYSYLKGARACGFKSSRELSPSLPIIGMFGIVLTIAIGCWLASIDSVGFILHIRDREVSFPSLEKFLPTSILWLFGASIIIKGLGLKTHHLKSFTRRKS